MVSLYLLTPYLVRKNKELGMYTIKLMNDIFHGPLWVYDENGYITNKYPLVTDDEEIKSLNDKLGFLVASFTSEDLHDFDEAGYKASYPKVKHLVEAIIQRLNEINDGSFTVKDCISNKDWDKES